MLYASERSGDDLHTSDWRQRLLGGYFRRWAILGILIGIVAGLGAIVFFSATDLAMKLFLGGLSDYTPPVPLGEGATVVKDAGRPWLFPLGTTIGGLLSGIIVYGLAPEAEGHGTDAAIQAFHEKEGHIRGRIPIIKLVASAITIGSGGSAGREGPTAQIAAGFGSWLGDFFHLTAQERRIAVTVGIGAGIGAIFKAPFGGAILATEILYIRDFEVAALIPGLIASAVGYSIFAAWAGFEPLFGYGAGLRFEHPSELLAYALLGLAAGLVGTVYVRVFYKTRDVFEAVSIPRFLKPAIGGLLVGMIAWKYPQVLALGYGTIQTLLTSNASHFALGTVAALVVLKIVATSLTVGSGGSGGVFAPGLFIGAMLGATLWQAFHNVLPFFPAAAPSFIIVGMMALFGGVAKSPIAVMFMVAEMTGEFSMIVPAMVATSIAYLVTGDTRIYENQVATREDSPAHTDDYVVPVVQSITVSDAMDTSIATLTPTMSINEAEAVMKSHGRRGLPVVSDGQLTGMFTESDALRARQQGKGMVADAMSREVIVVYPFETLFAALQRMARAGISRLPVVERQRPAHLMGMVGIQDLGVVLEDKLATLARGRTGHETAVRGRSLTWLVVRDVMRRSFETMPESMDLAEAAARFAASERTAAIVVDADGALAGLVTIDDVEEAAVAGKAETVGDIASRKVIVATEYQGLPEALGQAGAERLRQFPVVRWRDDKPIPVGMLNRADVTAAYLRSAPHRRTEAPVNGGGAPAPAQVRILQSTVPATSPAVSRTLSDLSLPDDVLVTGVRRGTSELIPRGSLVLEAGDVVSLLTTPGGEGYARSIIFDQSQPRDGQGAHAAVKQAQERLRAVTRPVNNWISKRFNRTKRPSSGG